MVEMIGWKDPWRDNLEKLKKRSIKLDPVVVTVGLI